MVGDPAVVVDSEDRLRRLVQAGIRVSEVHAIDQVLQAVVDSARDVMQARYAALGVFDPATAELKQFVTSGIEAEQVARMGPLPRGKGVLGLLVTEARPIRLADLGRHPRAHGFPPNHPPMTSFLGVPITGRRGPIGNLYLTEKIGASEFSADDESIAVLFAAQAAVALENAELHEESTRLLNEVRAIQGSRDRFFATINHELRNALTAVFGWGELLLRKLGPDPPRAAREVFESSERTLALLNDLLDLSRIEADRLRPTLRDTDASQIVADAVTALEPVAGKRSVRLAVVGTSAPVPCITDRQRVRQVLINLLSNAIRHSPAEATVTVTLAVAGDRLRFEVADQGPGIQPSEMARIFEAFGGGGAPSDERGTGLGLTLSRRLSVLLGGDLRATSRPGSGATFVVDLPRESPRTI